MSGQVLVPFAGGGAGEGPLSWGQRLMWNAMRRWESSLPLGGVTPLPPGLTAAALATVLRRIVSRHPSLRTRFDTGPDGEPRQRVHAAGEVPLELVDVPPGADPAAVAAEVRARYHDGRFDHATEWPVRMAVIRSAAEPVFLVALYSHLALDGAGLDVLVTDGGDPVTAAAPLDQVAWETSPAGRRHDAATLRYWEKQLRAVPARRFDPPPTGPPPRFRELQLRSRALELAARLVAARTGLDSPAVLLATSATALARVTGRSPSVQFILVSNRFRPGFAGSVSTVSQPGLCVIDAAGDFDDVVRRAWRGSLAAYKNAYCNPTRRDALHERVNAERGELVELPCYFNNRRTRPAGGPVPTAAEVAAARDGDGPRWAEQPESPSSEPFFVNIAEDPETVDLRISLDTRYVSAADTEAYAHEFASVLLDAALTADRV